jgi:hypothetical protein
MRQLFSPGTLTVVLVAAMAVWHPAAASPRSTSLFGDRLGQMRRDEAMTGAAVGRPKPQRVNRLASTLAQFEDRVDAYCKLRSQVVAKLGTLPKTSDPAVIAEREHNLGDAIREARPDAKPGDIFTPAIGSAIRRLIERDLASRSPVDRRAFVIEQPDVHVRVNDFYPLSSAPLATVPPQLLKDLPRLPDGLECRFVGSTLILRDADPNLVVDLLPDAIPPRYRKP